MRQIFCCSITLLLLTISNIVAAPESQTYSRIESALSSTAINNPAICIATHNVGNIVLSVGNFGSFGGASAGNSSITNCFTGEAIGFACEYPKGSERNYLYAGAFWIGGIVNRDTLVSVGADGGVGGNELFPDRAPNGNMVYRSITDPTKPWYEGAISEQDYIATYYDTCIRDCPGLAMDQIDHRSHRPLHVEVTQRTYAWSYPYADDFVLFDYTIRNIGVRSLKKVYVGIHIDSDVYGSLNDICGFRRTTPSQYWPDNKCQYEDTVDIAWVADAAGWAVGEWGQYISIMNVTGTRIVRSPDPDMNVSFNWWSGSYFDPKLDFGPQRKSKYRDFGTGSSGLPAGDRNKYWVLSNNEFDYDQIYAARNDQPPDFDWTTPHPNFAGDVADGYDTYYLLSFGPFNLESGQSLPLSFAYVGGMNFHKDTANFRVLPDNPDKYYSNLDFSNLTSNATWADWAYDNPGWDTDSDGYAGKYHICQTGDSTFVRIDSTLNSDSTAVISIDTIWLYETEDTIWYKGDGVPDFRAASPPPRPDIRTIMATGKIVIQFNGWRSETARDFFTHKVDFEGYRVYLSRDDRWSSYSLLDTYDRENYDKFVWDTAYGNYNNFVLKDDPFTMEQLKCKYAPMGCADSVWNPLDYSRGHPFEMIGYTDSLFYFTRHDFNRSLPGVNTNIRKLHPDAPFPKSLNKDSCLSTDTTDLGYFKHFEYEFTIDNLLPTVPYYISVTTFDFGAQNIGMPPMESPRTEIPIITYAMASTDSVEANNMKVGIYPNPYRIDGGYAELGYEGTGSGERDRPPDRNRRIHFYNLPAQCSIKIFSLDGDLVREIDHNFSAINPLSNHDTWDLITRNTQLAVSGLYYWTVESRDGKVQMGKLVLIM